MDQKQKKKEGRQTQQKQKQDMKSPLRVKQKTRHEMKIKTKNTYKETQGALLQRHDRGRTVRTSHKKDVHKREEPKLRKTHNVTIPTFTQKQLTPLTPL